MIYKLSLLTEDDNELPQYKDFYCDVDEIKGFWIPDLEEDEQPSINILIAGTVMSVLQEEDITAYINNKFSDYVNKK